MPARSLTETIHTRSRTFIALVVTVALFAAFPLTVAAQETPGALFTGMGFIDDHSVEDGAVVEAWIRGKPVAATEIFNQGFILYVVEPPGESFEGRSSGSSSTARKQMPRPTGSRARKAGFFCTAIRGFKATPAVSMATRPQTVNLTR